MTSCSLLFNFIILYYFLFDFLIGCFFSRDRDNSYKTKIFNPERHFCFFTLFVVCYDYDFATVPSIHGTHEHRHTQTHARTHTHTHTHTFSASFLPRYQTHSASRVLLQRENMIYSLENTRHRCKETNLCAPSHSFECTWLHSTQNSSLITGWKVQEEGSLAFTIDLLEIAEYR